MFDIDRFLDKPKRNSFIPLLVLFLGQLIGSCAEMYRSSRTYHFIYQYGKITSLLIGMFAFIFSMINAIHLYRQIKQWTRKEILLMLLTLSPFLYLLAILISFIYK